MISSLKAGTADLFFSQAQKEALALEQESIMCDESSFLCADNFGAALLYNLDPNNTNDNKFIAYTAFKQIVPSAIAPWPFQGQDHRPPKNVSWRDYADARLVGQVAPQYAFPVLRRLRPAHLPLTGGRSLSHFFGEEASLIALTAISKELAPCCHPTFFKDDRRNILPLSYVLENAKTYLKAQKTEPTVAQSGLHLV